MSKHTRLCSLDDCDRPHRAKGYCSTHYNKAAYGEDRHPSALLTCSACGSEYMTKRTNGRYCSLKCRESERHIWGNFEYAEKPCGWCGTAFQPGSPSSRYCSSECLEWSNYRYPKPKRDTRGKLRASVEDGDYEGVLSVLEARSKKVESGCWNWPVIKRGYPVAVINKSHKFVHRLSLEAYFGKPLGNQPVHHICANSECVNPEHLQLVSHRENVAEMLARNWMVQRITDLESALRGIAPDHPLLNEVSLGLNVAESVT